MTRNVVNLDALLPREDLAAPVVSGGNIKDLKIADVKPGLVYSWLRKPDFQRETANWSPQQVADLVETFANGDIIPAIILWQNGQRVFVVDGAHRLSALIAWVHDDYGAGKISATFFQNVIPEHQRIMHDETRRLIHERIGSFLHHEAAAQFPDTVDTDMLDRARTIAFKGIDVQWIENAGVPQARRAFFRINQGGTEIDNTEKRILNAQDSALAIASRAIARAGTGHSYWKKFAAEIREQIEALGAEIHKLLFRPQVNLPIKTLDVPLAGFGYGAHVLPFAFDLVALTNNIAVPDSTKSTRIESKKERDEDTDKLPDDLDGQHTIEYLRKTKRAVQTVLSTDPSSLGFHPALYFYTSGGAFQPAALLNVMAWIGDLEARKKVPDFLDIRKDFEELIVAHPVLVKPAVHKLGSGTRTRKRTVLIYERIFQLLSEKAPDVWQALTREPGFEFLASDDFARQQGEQTGTPG